jgi:hypothetical protein
MAYLALNDLIEQNWGHQLYTWGWKKPATEWWEGAIQAVKQRFPNVVLLAEVYSPWQVRFSVQPPHACVGSEALTSGSLCTRIQWRLQELGFDYTYDKQLYDRLSWGHLDYTKDWFIHNSPSFTKRSAHCTPLPCNYRSSLASSLTAVPLFFPLPCTPCSCVEPR